MHIISETDVYVAICAALTVILLIGEIKAERERRRRAEDDRDLWRKQCLEEDARANVGRGEPNDI